MMGVRLVFCETERGMSSLRRGWRTPDPSPSRDAATLPGCGQKLRLEEYLFGDDQASTDASTPGAHTPRQRGEYSGSGSAAGRFSRTPSPTPISRCSFEVPPAGQATFAVACPIPETAQTSAPLFDTTQLLAASGHAYGKAEEDASFCQPSFGVAPPMWMLVPPPPAPPSPNSPAECTSGGSDCEDPPSVGSIGHPLRCADPCKYARKPRGCKDGRLCKRCHCCVWKSSSSRGSRIASRCSSSCAGPGM